MQNSELRQRLSDITEREPAHHERLMRKLQGRHPHLITLIAVAPNPGRSPEQYTYFMYAFDMIQEPTVQRIMQWRNPRTLRCDVYPGADFVRHLIGANLLVEIACTEYEDGDVVIYYTETIPTHAGKMKGPRVISKWGLGHLWEHGLYEVPSTFGDDVRFFTRLTRRAAVLAFVEFARSAGVMV